MDAAPMDVTPASEASAPTGELKPGMVLPDGSIVISVDN
jgi:hypothetical protein